MTVRYHRVLMLVCAFALLVPTSGEADLHFALSKSAPADGEAVGSPAEVRLWFTEEAGARDHIDPTHRFRR